jgi:RHS repeat-associated protein
MTQDHRLQTIHHKYPGGATLSKFDYSYDVVGNIVAWQQQADSDPAVQWTYGYDAADQLTSAVKQTTAGTPTVLKRYGYGYDPAGNRTFERIDDQVTAATHDRLNRLLTHSPGGPLQFRGTVNEPATVTIQGGAASVDATNTFQGTLALTGGTNTVTVVATDPSGNQANRQYQVDVTGGVKTFTYDANGNLVSDGTRTFDWDARNQLVAVSVGMHRSEFTYDGQYRRVRKVEKENGVVQSDDRLLWCDNVLCEERDAATELVVERYFAVGTWNSAGARLVSADHLGSTREVTDATGVLVARSDYDPFGRTFDVYGSYETKRTFGRLFDASDGGLLLARRRAYDASLGRWIGEDPIGFRGQSFNFYSYVDGKPMSAVDPSGLVKWNVEETATYVDESALDVGKRCQTSPICGCTASEAPLKFKCGDECQPALALEINYHATISIANDIPMPKFMIRNHEEQHHQDNLVTLRQARAAGQPLERAYGSNAECEAAGKQWQQFWAGQLRQKRIRQDTASIYRRFCGLALDLAGY